MVDDLVLDQPTPSDVDDITCYCGDPAFERFMSLPWPYERSDAEFFVGEYVPSGWERGDEATWAIRRDGVFLGVIGVRSATSDVGFWLGAPFRGQNVMPRALGVVADWVFVSGFAGIESLRWECVLGNRASLAVARKAGFTFLGESTCQLAMRDGTHPPAWHGVLQRGDDRSLKPGWPLLEQC